MNGRERGQALPLGLALALLGMLGALVLYNTGRVATDKARLANAADAAAYSGLLWQARALNFQAYTNRAMVANEVSIAQAVSLRSWSAYGQTTSGNIANVLSVVPPMKVYAEGVASVMDTIDTFVAPVADAMVHVISGINRAVAASQEAMYASGFAATPEIVARIARESDPRFDATTAYAMAGLSRNLDDWRSFTHRYDARDHAPMLARTALVNDSLDDFSRERNWRLFDGFWFYSTPLTRHKIFREGGTRLVVVEEGGALRWEWKAVDTLSLQTRIFRFARSEKKREDPIGWGAARAGPSRGSHGLSDAACARGRGSPLARCGGWTANGSAERKALRGVENVGGYRGLDAFRSLGPETLERARRSGDPVLRLRTEIALDTAAVRASGTFVEGELLRADVVAPGERLSSISAAELFYRRPDDTPAGRGDASTGRLSDEGATGYNPYWDVRLAPVSTEERLLAIGLRGGAGTVAPHGTQTGSRSLAELDGDEAIPSGALPSGGASGTLPDYVGRLAGAGGDSGEPPDPIALGGALSDARTLALAGVEDFVGSADPAGDIERALNERLGSAVTDMLGGATRGVVGSIGRAVGAAQGVHDTALASLDQVAGEALAALEEARARAERGTAAAEGAADGIADVAEAVEGRVVSVEDALEGVGRGVGDDLLGALDTDAFEARIEERVAAARTTAQHFEDVRRAVAERMHADTELLHRMTLEEMLRPNFDEGSRWLPRQFRGYDAPLLIRIARHLAAVTLAIDPDAPISGVMTLEAAKSFYSEHVDLVRRGTPPSPFEPEGSSGESPSPDVRPHEEGGYEEGGYEEGDGTETPWRGIDDVGE